MKILLLSLLSILMSLSFAQAQLPTAGMRYSTSISSKIASFYQANKGRIPREALGSMPTNPNVPANLVQDLYRFDWLLVSTFRYDLANDKYCPEKITFMLRREDPVHGVLTFYVGEDGSSLAYRDNLLNIPQTVKKKSGFYYYCPKQNIPDAQMDYPVVDYRDGFLIVDQTNTGEVGDFNELGKVRQVFMAIPRYFDAATGQDISSDVPSPVVDVNPSADDFPYKKDDYLPSDIASKLKAYFEANMHKIPNEQTLKNMPINTNYPADIDKVLKENDLIEVCMYNWHTIPTEVVYRAERYPGQLSLRRFTKNAHGNWEFYCHRGETPRLKFGGITAKAEYSLKKVGVYTHFTGKDPLEKNQSYHVLVDCKDGFLIIDYTQFGRLNDLNAPVKMRVAYMIVPRFF